MIKSRPLFCSMAVVWMAFVLSLSIAIPILFRPFYYVHINAMDLPEQSGYSYQEIKDAYDDMMDFCVYGRQPFATGVMKYSEDGKSHFEDVAVLFKIDLAVRHPKMPDKYLLAVIFGDDAAAFGDVVRDSMILKASVLERMGWQVMRLWLLDWWQNPEAQVSRVAETVRRLLEEEES